MGESTLPCGTSTRERLEELRGDDFRSWDSFLNYLGDLFEEYNDEYRDAGQNPSGGGEFPELATKEDVEGLAELIREESESGAPNYDDVKAACRSAVSEELEGVVR